MITLTCNKCDKEMHIHTSVGIVPLSIPLQTYCEECFKQVIEESQDESKSLRGDMRF